MRIAASRIARVTSAPARPSLWLELGDGEGTTGIGEASPLPPFSREDGDACARALAGIHARLGEIDESLPAAEAISLGLQAIAGELPAVPSARFALETALADLLGRRRGISVAELLGGSARQRRAPVNALLMASPPEGLADRAAALAELGYPAIKIKLRAKDEDGFQREMRALYEVRERLPLPFELRLDPNGAWTIDEARSRLQALAPIAPRFVEQPVAAGELPRLGPTAVPWAADESLSDPALAETILDGGVCSAVVLKPAILGGLLAARSLAIRAQERGIDVVVTHLFDGPVALAAASELALSLPRPPLASGLDPHEALPAWPAIAVPQLAERGAVIAASSPGLGLSPFTGALAWIPSS